MSDNQFFYVLIFRSNLFFYLILSLVLLLIYLLYFVCFPDEKNIVYINFN